MQPGIIIQARRGSTRLPDKMVLPFHNDKGVLHILLERLKKHFSGIPIIVATTVCPADQAIADIAEINGAEYYRGDENDVLERFIEAAEKNNIDILVRICADNPFLDMEALKELIDRISYEEYDYYSFCTSSGIPTIKTHYGFWAEAVTLAALKKVRELTSDPLYHEHVTNYIYAHPESFALDFSSIPKKIEERKIRLTLDTAEDFTVQQKIYSAITADASEISIDDVIAELDSHPDYYVIMQSQIEKNSK